jgi:hypothetical protein
MCDLTTCFIPVFVVTKEWYIFLSDAYLEVDYEKDDKENKDYYSRFAMSSTQCNISMG